MSREHTPHNHYLAALHNLTYLQEREQRATLIAQLLQGKIRSNAILVDIGCGSGLIKRYLSEKLGVRIWGVEPDFNAVLDKQDVVLGSVLSLPLRTQSVDLLLCNNVLEHVADQETALHEMKRVLKADGSLYLTTGSRFQLVEPHYRLPLLSWLPPRLADFYVRATHQGAGYEHVWLMTYSRLTQLATRLGFQVHDLTLHALLNHSQALKPQYQKYGRVASRFPRWVLAALLKGFSPQWFLLLAKGRHL